MNDTPTVSVIIPAHNRANLLERAVKSVLTQSYCSLECIIVDDASTDPTREVVTALIETDKRVRYIRHDTNRHGSAARNSGLREARGEFIAYHDDDDEWLPGKLEKQMSLFSRLPQRYGCVYCWADWVDSEGTVVREHRPSWRGYVFAQTLVRNEIGCTPSLVIRKDWAVKTGPWNERLWVMDDDEYICRLCRLCEVDFVPEVLVRVYTGHGGAQVSAPSGPEGLRRSIEAIEARYSLFREERLKYPRQAAALEALMANLCVRLGDRRSGVRHFREAFRLAPLSWEPYHMLLSLVKWGVKRG